jgi:hypothetical protein
MSSITGNALLAECDRPYTNMATYIDTDLKMAQSILYRRLSANLYKTKIPGEYYHIHGSLDASKTLEMIGLPPFMPDLQDYHECISTIENAVQRFTVAELEDMNRKERQAGTAVLTKEQFLNTSHGKALAALPPYTLHNIENKTPPAGFLPDHSSEGSRQCLRGIRVLELCRVIAGPTIGRSLAAHGATVMKVTSANLPDVPFFQLDVNTGKHTVSLDLHDSADRTTFESLLATADVLIDGYRPGALDRLGYGPQALAELGARRNCGYIYISEDCFGGTGVLGSKAEWAGRPGWQQIADCVSGVAWEQGHFMGLNEPVIPPFPMSDYGTGILGCVAAMAGIYLRAQHGGSWICRTSLCQYDLFLLSLGQYPRDIQERLRRTHDASFFDLRHNDSVDEVGKRALKSMKKLHPELFRQAMMHTAWSEGYSAEVKWPKEAISIEGLKVKHTRTTRPNGHDKPTWCGWEDEDDKIQD